MSRLSAQIHRLLTQGIIDSLFDNHIYTTFDFVQTDVRKLVATTKMSSKDVSSVKKHIINKNAAVVRNGLSYYNEFLSKSSMLPTGIASVDKILGGGIVTGKIYELCGSPASGKTQFCLTLAKNVIVRLSQTVYFLDTKHDFNPRRLKRMCDYDKYQEEQTVDIFTKLLIKHISTIHDLINALYEIKEEIRNGQKPKLIIIDSLPAVLYQFETPGDFNPLLNHLVNIIRFLTVEMHVCIVVTNIYTTWYKDWSKEEGSAYTENVGCGKYWKNIPNVRMTFRKQTENQEVEVTLDENFTSHVKRCTVSINDTGVC